MILKSIRKTNLVESFLSLSSLQFINMILPLITLPYLVRVIGADYFGLISVALSVVMLFNLFVEFGFNLSATKIISVNRNNLHKISKTFFAVFYSKLLLFFISLFIFFFLAYFIDYVSDNILLFYITFGLVLGNLFLPVWFYLGIEKMRYLTVTTVILKIIATVMVFFLIKEKEDYLIFPLLNSIASIVSGIIVFFFAVHKFNLIFFRPPLKEIKIQLLSSLHFFLSKFSTQGSRYLVITLIGIYFGNLIAGFYAMADKIYMAAMSIGGVTSQSLYPFMSEKRDIRLYRKIFYSITGLVILILIPCIYLEEKIILLLFGLNEPILSYIFVILMLSLPFGVVSQLISYPLLAAFNFDKYANNSLIFSSIIYLVTVFLILLITNNIYYVACSVIFYNILRVFFAYYYIRKSKILNE